MNSPQGNGYVQVAFSVKAGIKLSGEKKEAPIFPDATYECARCGTRTTGAELAKLPSPTCANCGYRVFRKIRGPAAKNLKAE